MNKDDTGPGIDLSLSRRGLLKASVACGLAAVAGGIVLPFASRPVRA
ncbi:twin-arginine translocation signal domain-containing protein, partial [Laribacter hongkongensis]|nr:twin-arginine translocation signal domain-containing protein [Laribacter hongkongensis]